MDILRDNHPVVLGEAFAFRPWSDELGAFEIPGVEKFAGTHSSAFADVQNREYPLTSRELVFFGSLHYRGRGGKDPEVLERFNKAAAAHDLTAELAHYEPLFAKAQVKSAAAEPARPRVALLVKSASGPDIEAYPITCREDISFAAACCASDFFSGALPVPLFGQAAREIVKAAAEHGVENLPKAIYEAGVVRECDADNARIHIPANASPELKTAYASLIDAAPHASLAERDLLVAAWDQLDATLNAQRPRDHGTPYGVLFGGAPRELVVKAAREFVLFDKLGSHTLVPRAVVGSIDVNRAKQQLRAGDAAILETVIKAAASADQDPNITLIAQPFETQQRLLRTVLALTQ